MPDHLSLVLVPEVILSSLSELASDQFERKTSNPAPLMAVARSEETLRLGMFLGSLFD